MIGAAAAASESTLRFTGERDLDLAQRAVSATIGYVQPSRLSLRASLGAVVGGSLEGDGRRHDLGPGVAASIGVSQQWLRGAWFVTGSISLAASRVTTTEARAGAPTEGLVATDLRAGAIAGRRVGPVSPYVLARAFGGPVLWTVDGTDVTGTDAHHYQLGAGASLALPSGLAVVVDVSALGERSASLGVALRR